MKTTLVTLGVLLLAVATNAQSIFGKWKTIDDETKKAKSIVEIYPKEGKAYGKILRLLDESKRKSRCTECEGANKNKLIEGLVVLNGLQKDDEQWSDGTILDPKTGKTYKCILSLKHPNKLKVRGYIGFSLIGRTQYWERIK